jgi:hypothetical protein
VNCATDFVNKCGFAHVIEQVDEILHADSPARLLLLGRSVYGSNTDLPVSGAVEKMLPP